VAAKIKKTFALPLLNINELRRFSLKETARDETGPDLLVDKKIVIRSTKPYNNYNINRLI
jgi:hypothetical protein